MIKHTFTTEHTYENQPHQKHTTETNACLLSGAIEAFELHLRGAGFAIKIGSLQIVDDETESGRDRDC